MSSATNLSPPHNASPVSHDTQNTVDAESASSPSSPKNSIADVDESDLTSRPLEVGAKIISTKKAAQARLLKVMADMTAGNQALREAEDNLNQAKDAWMSFQFATKDDSTMPATVLVAKELPVFQVEGGPIADSSKTVYSSVEAYVEVFEEQLRAYNMVPMDQYWEDLFAMSCHGRQQIWFNLTLAKHNYKWSEVCDYLEREFKDPLYLWYKKAEYYHLTQQPNEPIAVFLDRFLSLSYEADVEENLQMAYHFVSALDDFSRMMAWHVLVSHFGSRLKNITFDQVTSVLLPYYEPKTAGQPAAVATEQQPPYINDIPLEHPSASPAPPMTPPPRHVSPVPRPTSPASPSRIASPPPRSHSPSPRFISPPPKYDVASPRFDSPSSRFKSPDLRTASPIPPASKRHYTDHYSDRYPDHYSDHYSDHYPEHSTDQYTDQYSDHHSDHGSEATYIGVKRPRIEPDDPCPIHRFGRHTKGECRVINGPLEPSRSSYSRKRPLCRYCLREEYVRGHSCWEMRTAKKEEALARKANRNRSYRSISP